MRNRSCGTLFVVALACATSLSASVLAAQQTPSKTPGQTPGQSQVQPDKLEHPGDVALIEETSNTWIYRQFPTGLRLYVNDRDTPGKPTCIKECAFAWPPLVAHEGARPMGDWTLVPLENGEKQWAYKGHPVYMLFHDSPAEPQGNGAEGIWHFLEP